MIMPKSAIEEHHLSKLTLIISVFFIKRGGTTISKSQEKPGKHCFDETETLFLIFLTPFAPKRSSKMKHNPDTITEIEKNRSY